MWQSIIKRLKSKTYLFNIAVGAVGILELNFGLLREALGPYYPAAFIVVAVAGFVLRELTKAPVSEK